MLHSAHLLIFLKAHFKYLVCTSRIQSLHTSNLRSKCKRRVINNTEEHILIAIFNHCTFFQVYLNTALAWPYILEVVVVDGCLCPLAVKGSLPHMTTL